MKIKLLKKWNFLMRHLFIGGFTYNMSLIEKAKWSWSWIFDRRMRKLAFDAYLEFNENHAEFHYLGYDIGIGIMTYYLSKNKIQMNNDRKNVWDEFAYKWRRYSRKWNLPSEKLKRAIAFGER